MRYNESAPRELQVPRPSEMEDTGHLSSRSLLLRKMAMLMLLEDSEDEEGTADE